MPIRVYKINVKTKELIFVGQSKPRTGQGDISKACFISYSIIVENVFLLFVFLGIGEQKKIDSADMFFRDLNECVWYAEKISEQGNSITSYCLPKMVNSESVMVY